MMALDRLDREHLLYCVKRLLFKQPKLILDLLMLGFAFALAYLLRFDFAPSLTDLQRGLVLFPYVVLLQFTAMLFAGVNSYMWRYIGLAEIKAFILAAIYSSGVMLVLRVGLPDAYSAWRVPLSVIVMDTVLAFGGVLILRVARRVHFEYSGKRQRGMVTQTLTPPKKSVLLLGAGRAGVMVVREILLHNNTDLEIKGFIDDDIGKVGSIIQGVKVLGTTKDLARIVAKLEIDHVIISIAQAKRAEFRRLLDICEKVPVKVRVIPALSEILQGKVKISRIRDVELEDLLGRAPVQLDEASMRAFLCGKTVMVTGAGGSIGSELVRQIAGFDPRSLLLVERAEFALFNIEREIREAYPSLSLEPLVADITHEARIRHIFDKYRPQVVIHAAAHKHVPMMEINSSEAIRNNSLGTLLVGQLAGEYNAETFVLISTDKAVRPRSVMGASKRIAELFVQDLNTQYATRFAAVRFGNVLGSSGSVIPIFREQIRKGGPVMVTHPEMARYFMTIPEASQLVLQAGALCLGGEIFILDMGEQVKIVDLARDTISLSGLKPFEDIDIVFTGIRPGEKLTEELETQEESLVRTLHPKIFIGEIAARPKEKLRQAITQLQELAERDCEEEIRAFLSDLLPESLLVIDSVQKTYPAREKTDALWVNNEKIISIEDLRPAIKAAASGTGGA